ncbi:putative transcriptional regulator, Crp/Fnr family [Desulfovibrio sp. X2]|uniref:cyclic nucleotide-binding domain-containing protein n=1 Tax=Desulfovibrio sp. X2 TaxID=941449 RepID=UPI00035885BF|nr:cyclic nucleotide-binding domain-containing protein [Desulfovibrio sp. X2]EPR41737.1 putative transcriptional regulator, Crp/Fnr family [Desulfovibrio sp. X2]
MSSSTERNEPCAAKQSCEFTQNIELLRQVPLFAALPLEPLKILAYLAQRETFAAGDILFHEGEADGQAFYIISGNARLLREEETGTRELRDYGEGEFLGGLGLLGEMRRLFSLRAETQIRALVLTRERFAKVLEQFPDIHARLGEAMVKFIGEWEEHVLRDQGSECLAYCGVSLL